MTSDPNTSAKASRYKWEPHRDTNGWCIHSIHHFQPRRGTLCKKYHARSGRCIPILFTRKYGGQGLMWLSWIERDCERVKTKKPNIMPETLNRQGPLWLGEGGPNTSCPGDGLLPGGSSGASPACVKAKQLLFLLRHSLATELGLLTACSWLSDTDTPHCESCCAMTAA